MYGLCRKKGMNEISESDGMEWKCSKGGGLGSPFIRLDSFVEKPMENCL